MLAVSWFGSPERLFSLSERDRKMLAEHDRQIENLREHVLGRREAPTTAVESAVEWGELRRLVLHRAGENLTRAESALLLMRLNDQRPLVARLQKEKVAQARKQDRVGGLSIVGTGFALAWAIRRWRR
jgi:hypothetical protein